MTAAPLTRHSASPKLVLRCDSGTSWHASGLVCAILNKKPVKAHVYADGSENPTAEYWELLMEMIETCLMDRPAAD